jgi:hypothetical protein
MTGNKAVITPEPTGSGDEYMLMVRVSMPLAGVPAV